MITSWAPGKLMLSGEWSVLEVGNPAIVVSVDKGVSAKIEESKRISFSFPDIGIEKLSAQYDGSLAVDLEDKSLSLPLSAVKTSLDYISAKKESIIPFHLKTESEISRVDGAGEEKIGFGSSAASTVAIISAILQFHKIPLDRMLIFKLSAFAHYKGQGRAGSGFDIAASTFGGINLYYRFDPNWLFENESTPINELVEIKWPELKIKPLSVPKGFQMAVGWTGKSASTKMMIQKMKEFKKREPEEYYRLISEISKTTEKLSERFSDPASFSLLEQNRKLLSELGERAEIDIETPKLAKLASIAKECGAYGKLSGAGGGDCGIAVCFGDKKEKLFKMWKKDGILPVEASISKKGVVIK